jgi:hypothetical protein
MLIAGKCAPLYNKLDYNIKNEPPYLQFRYPIILKNLNNFDFFFLYFFGIGARLKFHGDIKLNVKIEKIALLSRP